MRAQRFPERLLSVAELVFLTGLHKNTVIAEINNAASLLHRGALLLKGKLAVPVSSYNAWVESQRIDQEGAR